MVENTLHFRKEEEREREGEERTQEEEISE